MAKGYRYPGTKPFSTEDESIFYGRKQDVDRLYQLLNLKNMLIFYSASGMGKSSLIKAGLIPRFNHENKENTFLPVTVRFGANASDNGNNVERKTLLNIVIAELTKEASKLEDKNLPFATEAETYSSLWCLVKLFEKNNARILLIVDQAEEIFTYEKEEVNQFKQEVYMLFNKNVPGFLHTRIEEQLDLFENESNPASAETRSIEFELDPEKEQSLQSINSDIDFIYSPLKSKILFAVREDKLGLFNVFNDYFPDVLKDTYKLLPLSAENAIEAITGPAQIEGEFESAPFDYSGPALEKLLNSIKEDNETYDPFSIQLNCSYIELNCIIKEGKKIINETDIPEEGKIVKDYYENVWKSIPGTEQEKENYKKEIEEKLIDEKQETRKYVYEKDLSNIAPVLEVLLHKGLMRRDQRGEDHYVELSHDRLLRPLIEASRQRIAEENARKEYEQELRKAEAEKAEAERRRKKTKSRIYTAVLIAVGLIGLAIYLEKRSDKEFALLQAYNSVEKSNPTLAYNIAVRGKQKNFGHFVEILDSVEEKKLGYITSAFTVPDNVLAVYLDGSKNEVIVVGENEIKYFNKSGLIDSVKSFQQDIVYSTFRNGKGYIILQTTGNHSAQNLYGDFDIKTFSDKPLFTFYYDGPPEALELSADGSFLIAGKNIFNTGDNNAAGQIPANPSKNANVTTACFSHDGTSVINGNWRGYVYHLGDSIQTGRSAVVSLKSMNDSVVIERSEDNNINFINIGKKSTSSDENNEPTNQASIIKKISGETIGLISSMGVCNCGDKAVIGSEDQQARVYDSKGNKIATLKGHTSRIVSANFSSDGEEIVTASSNGEVFVWKVKKPKVLYETGEMRRLSPLDCQVFQLPYEKSGDEKDSLKMRLQHLVSDNVSFVRQFYSEVEGDENHSSISSTLMNEFESVIHTSNLNPLNTAQKRLLFSSYSKIINLQLERTDTSNVGVFNALIDKKDSLAISSILLDTLDIYKALQFSDLFDYYIDGLVKTDYEQVMKYSYKKINVLYSFYLKDSTNEDIKKALLYAYNNAAYYSCFVNKYDEAIDNSLKGVRIDSNATYLNTNLALGYLLSGRFDAAVDIYNRYKHKSRPDAKGYLLEDFRKDLDEMESSGIIDEKNTKLNEQVQYIRNNILNS